MGGQAVQNAGTARGGRSPPHPCSVPAHGWRLRAEQWHPSTLLLNLTSARPPPPQMIRLRCCSAWSSASSVRARCHSLPLAAAAAAAAHCMCMSVLHPLARPTRPRPCPAVPLPCWRGVPTCPPNHPACCPALPCPAHLPSQPSRLPPALPCPRNHPALPWCRPHHRSHGAGLLPGRLFGLEISAPL